MLTNGGAREVVIVSAVRTPLGKGRPDTGALAGVHPGSLLGVVLREAVNRSGADAASIDDVIVGCVSQAGEQTYNIARTAWLGAGLPESVPATTVDRQCGSSQQALHFASQAIRAGDADTVVVGGVESMSRVPMFSSAQDSEPQCPEIRDRYSPGLIPQGLAAEIVSARRGITRRDLDEVAATSHARAAEAARRGLFDQEIVPVPAPGGLVKGDEGIRPSTTAERLATLTPAFVDDEGAQRFPEIDEWRVTAGNSSQISDGASALVLMERSRAASLGIRPIAAVRHGVVAADDPIEMFTAVVPATQRVLERAGMGISDVDLFEVNEAFACVLILWQRAMVADPERLNVHGGAIALGHPLGASGARLMTTLLHALVARDATVGLQTICEAGGMANSTIVERLT